MIDTLQSPKVLSDHVSWKSGEWEYRSFNSNTISAEEWKFRIDDLKSAINNPKSIIKHDHRSEVMLIEFAGEIYVVKKFILQQTWWWFKLTSISFPTLGEIACTNAVRLKEAGLLTPQPSLLMQRRSGRMAVESLLIYPYLSGTAATVSDTKSIVAFVHKMHDADWVHRDPHPANFLVTPTGLATIDPVRARKTRSKYLKAYDVMLMEHDMPDARELYGRESLGVLFAMAQRGHDLVRFYRKSKKIIRRSARFGTNGRPMNSVRQEK